MSWYRHSITSSLVVLCMSLLHFIRKGMKIVISPFKVLASKFLEAFSPISNDTESNKKPLSFFLLGVISAFLLSVYHRIDNSIWQSGQIISWYTPVIIKRMRNSLEPSWESVQSYISSAARRILRTFRSTPPPQLPTSLKCDWDSFYDNKSERPRTWMLYNHSSGALTPSATTPIISSNPHICSNLKISSTPGDSESGLPTFDDSLLMASVGESTLFSSSDSFLDSPSVYSCSVSSSSTSVFLDYNFNDDDKTAIGFNGKKLGDEMDISEMDLLDACVAFTRPSSLNNMTVSEGKDAEEEIDLCDIDIFNHIVPIPHRPALSPILEDNEEFWRSSKSSTYTFTVFPFTSEHVELELTGASSSDINEPIPSSQLDPAYDTSHSPPLGLETSSTIPALSSSDLLAPDQHDMILFEDSPDSSDDYVLDSGRSSLLSTPCEHDPYNIVDAFCASSHLNVGSRKVNRSARIVHSISGLAIALNSVNSRDACQLNSSIWDSLNVSKEVNTDLRPSTVSIELPSSNSAISPQESRTCIHVSHINKSDSVSCSDGLDRALSLELANTSPLDDDSHNSVVEGKLSKPTNPRSRRTGFYANLPQRTSVAMNCLWDTMGPTEPVVLEPHPASRRVGLHGRLPRQRFPDVMLLTQRESLTLEARHRSIIQERHRSPNQNSQCTGLRDLVLPARVAANQTLVSAGPPPASRGDHPVRF